MLPSDFQLKVMELERQSKKRKDLYKESGKSFTTSLGIADSILNDFVSSRPKLKAKKSIVIQRYENNIKQEIDNDTPAMHLYRKKLSQRKAALEIKNITSKTSKQKQKKFCTSPEGVPQAISATLISETQRRTRRTSSAISDKEVVSSSSNTSNTSTTDTTVKEISSIIKMPKRTTRNLIYRSVDKLPKIQKTQLLKTNTVSSKLHLSSNKVCLDANKSKESSVNGSNRTVKPRQSIKKILPNDRIHNLKKSLSNKSSVSNGYTIDTARRPVQKNVSNNRLQNLRKSLNNECFVYNNNTIGISKKSAQKSLLNQHEQNSKKNLSRENSLNNYNIAGSSIKSIPINLSNEELRSFRRVINERDKKYSPTSCLEQIPINNNLVNMPSVEKSKLFNQQSPILYKSAHTRLYSLENRVRNNGLLKISNQQERLNEEENIKNKRILNKIEVADIHCEQMDWEPIEDEKIMSEVYSVRFQLCERPTDMLNEFSSNVLQSLDTLEEKHALFIVIDTNVFLSNLSFIEEIRDSCSDIFGRPFIVIPWTVLQELDFIKDNKNHTRSQGLKIKARKAVEFLNQHFTAKHPRFLGQTPMDVEKNKKKFVIECPDDEILQTCLQIKESLKSPLLLSYDKNLCNKAMIHDIPILGRNDPLEKMYYLKAAESTEFLSLNLHEHVDKNKEDVSILQKELLAAEDIMENGKAVLKAILSEIVSKEMENLFGNRWEMYVIIRPPWSIITVLKCTLKHWMAAICESFTRRTESMLRDILLYINEVPVGGRKLHDVKFFLDKCNDIIQTLNNVKYPTLKSQMLTQIDELKKTCVNTMEELKKERFRESVGSEEDKNEEERRAALAFKVFEEIYTFARDTCGLSADAMGLSCSFSYNNLHPFLTKKIALQQLRDVGISLNRLLQILRTTLSKVNEGVCLDDKIILTLYEDLVNFSSDLNFEELSLVTPLDVFCCIKLKKATLEKGYEQLQELAIHFCQMANYQC